MKKAKSILSVLLCAAILLSCAPVFNLNLFSTQASAASYTKKHEKEYYFPSGTTFISYIATGYGKKAANAKGPLTNSGYTVIDRDLNDGAGGKYIYCGYKTTTDVNISLKDLRISIGRDADTYTAPENSSLYTVAGVSPTSQNTGDADGIVDLNKDAGGDYLYYFATKDAKAGDPILEIIVDNSVNANGYDTVKYLNSANFNTNADANKGAGGDDIYTHVKRLPQVDTTKLRTSMETASNAYASTTFTDASKAAVKSALDAAKVITDAYDNYRAGTDSYSTVYNQTKIDNAKKAVDEAVANLVEKVDTSNAPKIKFYVPETIYLNPDNGTAFQYMAGVDTNGLAYQPKATPASSAKIYFDGIDCEPSSVKITCEASTADNSSAWKSVGTSAIGSITFGGTSFNGTTANSTGKTYTSFPVDTDCSAGSLSSAVASGNIRFIRWRADYVLDGVTNTVYAYSICYRQPSYTAYFRHSSRQYTSWNHSPAFINAALTVTGLNVESISGEDGTTSSGSGGTGSNNNNSTETRDTSIIVDSSRFTNYMQLPYFGAQYSILGSRENGTATVTAYNSNATATAKTIGTTKTLIDLPITSSALVVYMHASAVNEGDTAQNDTYINITPTLVNKAELRKTYNNAISEMRQEKMFTMGFDAYQNSILDAAVKLGNPINKNLKVKINTAEMERKTGTVTTSYVRDTAVGADYDGKLGEAIKGTSSSSQSFTLGEDVYVKYQDIFGYTLSGYSISDATGVLTTGTPKADANDYFIRNAGSTAMKWKFIYTPNSYPVSYDPNGGSFNGSSTVTNTSAYYQSKYSVGSVDGTTIAEPTREGYTFTGWVCDADGATYNTDAKINWDYTKTVKFTAQWSIKSYTVTFKNGDDVLQESKWEYNTTPTYNGATPTKSKDDNYEYTFSGWTPEISAVKDDIAYYAQYSKTAHDYRCDILDGKQHQYVCNDCGYKKAPEKHKLVYVKTDNGYSYTCSECGYSYTTTAKAYSVEFSCDSYSAANNAYIKSECEKYAAANPPVYNEAKSKNYYIATIKAPMTITENGQKMYFVYWLDAETGEKVGTYTTYRYFQTKSSKFTPVYATQQEYYAMRNQAVIASRVVDCRLNDNGSYSLLAEHSVASSCESIKGHGVIYTTEAANAGMLTTDNDNVEKKAALKSANALTGLLEVSVDLHGANTVWARTYVIDANNEVHYGTVRQFDVTAGTSSAGDEIVTLGAESYDLTDLNSDAEAPTIEDEPTEKSPLEILKTVFSKLIEIINEIISYFTKPGAKK
jgi:uncharacterized repeat protein (TIGR02543 family)